jgi:uncharacterized RDD family membrane protein YckC
VYAGFWRRSASGIIDAMVGPSFVLAATYHPNPQTANSYMFIGMTGWLVNSIIAQGLTGRSIGRLFTKTALLRKAKYTPIGWLVSLWRQIVGVPIILFTLGFSELLVLFTKYKQTLYDILSGAVVVRIDVTRAPQVAGRKAPSNPWTGGGASSA